MKRQLWSCLSVLLFVLGTASLALTVYLWVGDWPRRTKEILDHQRSVVENAQTAASAPIANVYARRFTRLGGSWEAVIDPYRQGDLAGVAPRAVEPQSPSDLAEFSFRNGLRLEVPGDWNTQDPRLVFYQGVVWYKREFSHTPQRRRRSYLWFGAANYRAAVYLNGLLLGRHEGGFTPFNFEVTGRLREGDNLLVVRVDSERGADDVPAPTTDWHNYGGLTRDVLLIDVPETFVRDYLVQLVENADDRIGGWIELEGERAGREVRLRIPELGVDRKMTSDERGRVEFAVSARPELWTPDRPRLYEVEISSGEDLIGDQIGFRSVAVRGDEILLNGQPIFLRGISLHEEAPGQGQGRAHSPEHAERLLGWASELGANFVRLAHYPHSQHMARLADRLGLLVWEEIPVYWDIDFGNPVTRARAERQLSELIARDRNRASVVLWSIGNETPTSPERQQFMSALAQHVRRLDPSRLVTAALLTSAGDLVQFVMRGYLPALLGLPTGDWIYRVRDPLAELVDVQALNQYFGWYYSGAMGLLGPFSSHHTRRVMIDHMHRIRIESESSKPMLMSELGAGAKAGLHAPEHELVAYSEEYQALVYRRQIEMLRQQSGLAGLSPWVLKDFRSPLRLYQGVQDYWNRKGLISERGEKKAAFEVLQRVYREMAGQGRESG